MASKPIQKGPGRWLTQISLGTRPDGSRDRQGVIVYGRTLTEATREAQRVEAEMKARAISARAGTMTVAEWAEEWLEKYVDGGQKAHRTAYGYRAILDNRILPALGRLQLRRLTAADINRAINGWSRAPRLDGKDGPLCPNTVIKYIACLSSMLTEAARLDYISANVVRAAHKPRAVRHEPQFYGPTEVQQLQRDLLHESARWRALVLVGAGLGLRRGEIAALQWADLDFDAGLATIRRSTYVEMPGYRLRDKVPKTAASWSVLPIIEETAEALKAWRDEQAVRRNFVGDAWQGGDYVFTVGDDGQRWHINDMTREFSAWIKERKLPPLTLHGLRHTCGTLLLITGADIRTVQALLRHASITTTQRYVHPVDEYKRAAANGLQRIFDDDTGNQNGN